MVEPALLLELDEALSLIEHGKVIGVDSTNGRIHYTFKDFTVLMNKN